MISSLTKTRRMPRAGGRRGFALVTTLALLVLLLLVAVGLLSLSTITVRTAARESAAAEARANARLALILAIGELQKTMGRDQFVSGPAGLLDASPESAELDGLSHPHLTGVWSARNEALAAMPDYDREAPFRQWLVSERDREKIEKLDLVQVGELTDPVLIVNPPVSAGADPGSGEVYAGRVPTETGAYAWWVADENCKARVGMRDELDRENGADVADLLASMATPGTHGIRGVGAFGQFPSNTEISDKVITLGQLGLAAGAGKAGDEVFHDFTPYSESVLADVTRGGLRKDLSLYLERSDIDWLEGWGWPEVSPPRVPTGPRGPNNDYALSNPKDGYDVLSWKSLHHWYNIHRRQIGSESAFRVKSLRNYEAFDKVENPTWNSGVMRFQPVLARMQLIISYGVQKVSEASGGVANYDLYLYCYPVLTLWNPNSVGMEVDQFNVFLHTLPLEHTVYVNDKKFSLPGKWNGNYYWQWGGNNAGTTYMRFGDVWTPGIQFAPGESKILTYVSSDPGAFHAHDMVDGYLPWLPSSGLDEENPHGHMGGPRWLGSFNGKPSDRISIETRGSGWLTSGSSNLSRFQTTFGFRCEPKAEHVTHTPGLKKQWFCGQVCWRRETDQGNPVADFISKNNFPSQSLSELENNGAPFIHLDVRLKTLDEVQLPNKTWLHSIPSHPFASATSTNKHSSLGVDAATTFFAHPYTVTFEQINGIEGVVQNKPFFGPSNRPGGLGTIVAQDIPLVPLTSLAQLQNLPQYPIEALNWSGYYFQNHAIGNSYASPGLAPEVIKEQSFPFYLGQYFAWDGGDLTGKLYNYDEGYVTWFNNDDYTIDVAPAAVVDRSYAANHLLFDSYFFSGMAAQKGQIFQRYGSEREIGEVVREFFEEETPLPNAAYQPYLRGVESEDVIQALTPTSTQVSGVAHERAAAWLMANGGFNINSTSVAAWTAFLGSAHLKRPVTMSSDGSLKAQDRARFVVSRFNVPIGEAADGDPGAAAEQNRWLGYRELTEEEVRQLAEAIVEQVKKRGPFRSLGEFVNRRRSTDTELARYGALQAALEDPEVKINENYRSSEITENDIQGGTYKANYKFKEAALGSRYQGTPAYISQADILTPIAPLINARSDTFMVRGYGEARSRDGKEILARAWCQAVVQRVPEYLNPSDAAYTDEAALKFGVNKMFGRRFLLKSFRWISPSEIEPPEVSS